MKSLICLLNFNCNYYALFALWSEQSFIEREQQAFEQLFDKYLVLSEIIDFLFSCFFSHSFCFSLSTCQTPVPL